MYLVYHWYKKHTLLHSLYYAFLCYDIIYFFGNTFFRYSTLDILLTVSNFVTTCQLAVIRVLVDCLINIFLISSNTLLGPQHTT